MDGAKYRARSCDALNIKAQESQLNLQTFTSIIKQETIQALDNEEPPEDTDEEEALSNGYMCHPLKSLDCVNYYDSEFDVLEEVKKESPDSEYSQPDPSLSSSLVFENEEFSKIMGTQDVEQENQKQGLSSIIKQEINDDGNQFILKTERQEEYKMLENAGDTNNHCDVLVTHQEIKCKLCGKTFSNSFDLSQHNNEHIKAVPPTPFNNEMNDLHKCQCCEEYFNNSDTMLAHLNNVHNNKKPKSSLCQDDIKPFPPGKNSEEIKYKCDSCERVYKNKLSLVSHLKRIHYEYGKMFECWCGKQFRSPVHLSEHKYNLHSTNIKNKNIDKFQCDFCQKIIRTKACLILHIRSVHYDYGKIFKCWCGKQFSTPIYLYKHKNRQHGFSVKKAKQKSSIKKHKSNVTRVKY